MRPRTTIDGSRHGAALRANDTGAWRSARWASCLRWSLANFDGDRPPTKPLYLQPIEERSLAVLHGDAAWVEAWQPPDALRSDQSPGQAW